MIKNEILSCDVFTLVRNDPTICWHFGDPQEGGGFMNLGGCAYRCRIVVSDKAANEAYHYFFASIADPANGPTVVGEHLFDHMQTWENRQGRNPNVEGLFSYQ